MIRLEGVSKIYRGQNYALRNVSCEIKRGEFVFLVGPSGSGKSTFLRLLNRQEKPNSGSVFVAGRDVGQLRRWRVPSLRRNVGCVFQDYKLLPNKSVYKNVAFALEVLGDSKAHIRQQVSVILDLVGLADKAWDFPDELSGGEQQRVAVARAFINRPMVLLADEPTGNLDPQTSMGIMQLLMRISDTGTTIVMATHESQLVDMMKRRVLELSAGGELVRDESSGVYE